MRSLLRGTIPDNKHPPPSQAVQDVYKRQGISDRCYSDRGTAPVFSSEPDVGTNVETQIRMALHLKGSYAIIAK